MGGHRHRQRRRDQPGCASPSSSAVASLDDDGLVGFFLDADPGSLSSPYGPSASGYVTTTPATVTVGQPAALTLLLHPQGTVHAFTGLLPPVTAALPQQFQLAPVRATEVTFRSGPLLTPPTAVQLPLPAFSAGDWAWLEYDRVRWPCPAAAAVPGRRLGQAARRATDAAGRLAAADPRRAAHPAHATRSRPPRCPPTTGGPPAQALTMTAYNATSAAVTCDSITITLPVGTDPGALTASPGLIQPVSAQPASWTFQAGGQGQPGTFIATPIGAASAVASGVTLGFTLASLGVSQHPGLSAIQITEVTAQGQATLTLAAERFTPGPPTPAGNP